MGLNVNPLDVSNIDGKARASQRYIIQAIIPDISTAQSVYTASLPFDYEIEGAYITDESGVTVADSTITLEVNGTAVDGCSAVVPAGGGAGNSVAFSAPTGGATNEMNEGDVIEVITDGGSTTSSRGIVNILVKRRA